MRHLVLGVLLHFEILPGGFSENLFAITFSGFNGFRTFVPYPDSGSNPRQLKVYVVLQVLLYKVLVFVVQTARGCHS